MQRSHKTRLYPNKGQELLLSKTVGVVRYVYNWGLSRWNEKYKNGERCSWVELSRLWTVERPEWSKEVSRTSQTRALYNLGGAFTAFFQQRSKHPDFHKKGVHDSFYVDIQHGKICGKKIRIPNVGYVKMAEELRYSDAEVLSYVVSRRSGKWYVSIQCEIPDEVMTTSESVVGIDVGCKNWITTSDGEILKAPGRIKDYERQLKRKQRLLARKQKGSNRRAKARLAVARAYEKIQNIKLDAIHKFTSTITKNHGIVVVEDLNVESMREKGLKSTRKGIQNSAMSEILRQLSYKANTVVKVSRYYPSSKRCSHCGNVKEHLTLSDRTYHCDSCHTTIDRDLNASFNILQEGLRLISLSTVGHTVKDCGDSLKDFK